VNSRVARELRPALPAELPLYEQRRLVHGFACWLKDEFGVAVHWVVHAPSFHKKMDSKRFWRDRKVSVRCPRSDGGIECLLDVHH